MKYQSAWMQTQRKIQTVMLTIGMTTQITFQVQYEGSEESRGWGWGPRQGTSGQLSPNQRPSQQRDTVGRQQRPQDMNSVHSCTVSQSCGYWQNISANTHSSQNAMANPIHHNRSTMILSMRCTCTARTM